MSKHYLISGAVAVTVAMGAYGMDSHNCRRLETADGFVRNEGNVEDYVAADGRSRESTTAPSYRSARSARTWTLTLTRGVEERTFVVSDFASLSNVDDPDNWFSLWF